MSRTIEAPPSKELVFEIPGHVLRVSGREGSWLVTVDQDAQRLSAFATVAEAWAAGVRAAERLDRAV
jgi:hypothetical protein